METKIGLKFNCKTKEVSKLLVDLPKPVWHKPDKPIRVAISEEVKREWLILKLEHEVSGNHPYISALLEYVKSLILNHVKEGDMNYYYLASLFPEDEAIIRHYGGSVELKPQ
jgi:hypothetical protein